MRPVLERVLSATSRRDQAVQEPPASSGEELSSVEQLPRVDLLSG
jgi:hypothetical protein